MIALSKTKKPTKLRFMRLAQITTLSAIMSNSFEIIVSLNRHTNLMSSISKKTSSSSRSISLSIPYIIGSGTPASMLLTICMWTRNTLLAT